MTKRFTIEYVRKYFEDAGCVLLSEEYSRTDIPLKYICNCGEQSEIAFSNFKSGKRCRACGYKKTGASHKLSYGDVKKCFEGAGYVLLTETYINNRQKLDYICDRGHHSNIAFSHFKSGNRCRKCKNEKLASEQRFTYKYVMRIFEENDCTLLEKQYINANTLMQYICNCGERAKISFWSFKNGSRCKKCATEKISGKNSPRYKLDKTDEERVQGRKFRDYRIWRKLVLERDACTCQACGANGVKLVAHHLDGYNWAKEKRLDINNGVTLCRVCHDNKYPGSFHSIYGNGDNTRDQYSEYIRNKMQTDSNGLRRIGNVSISNNGASTV